MGCVGKPPSLLVPQGGTRFVARPFKAGLSGITFLSPQPASQGDARTRPAEDAGSVSLCDVERVRKLQALKFPALKALAASKQVFKHGLTAHVLV